MPTLQDCDNAGTDFRDLEAQLTARRYGKRKNTFADVARMPLSSTEVLI